MSDKQPGPMITAGRLAWQNADAIVRINVLWFALTVPLITAPQALAGLYAYTHKLAREQGFPTTDDFWNGFHILRGAAWRWTLLNLFAAVVLASNLLFYGWIDTQAARALTWGWAIAGVNWFALQGYVFPLFLLQEQPRLRTALRNALVIYIRHPIRTVAHTAIALAIAVASSAALLPWVLFSGAVLTLLGNQVVLHSVRLERERRART